MHDTRNDFSDAELWTLRQTLEERYGDLPDLQFGDAEMRLGRQDRELTSCPIVAWRDGTCTLVVAKARESDYRCEFFYRVHEHFGTGIERFDNFAECLVTLLQVQADHARQRSQDEDE